GADIINCSWGSYSFSDLGNDIINYATDKGSLVVAAVGNDGRNEKFYPAAYENALAVGMTDSMDMIRSNSNYGRHVDVLAIGQGMSTTSNNSQYNYNGGTSMASPLVSGAAGLVKAHYPHFTPMQIAERIRNTADNLDYKHPSTYHSKIGNGRLNMYRSVAEPLNHGVRTTLVSIDDLNDSSFVPGDTLRLIVDFTNYLSPGTQFTATLTSPNSSLLILRQSFSIGSLNTFETKNNSASPFLILIKENAALNELVEL